MRTSLCWAAVAAGLLLGGRVHAEVCAGKVLDEAGKPLEGVQVRAYHAGADEKDPRDVKAVFSTTTGKDGGFRFESLASKTGYTLVADAPGYALDWVQWPVLQPAEVRMVASPPSSIGGLVVDEKGQPVPGATISAIVAMDVPEQRFMWGPLPGGPWTVKTGDDGRYLIERVPATALIGFELNGPGRATLQIDPQYTPGQSELRMTLKSGACVEGQIIDAASGRGLAGLHLRVANEEDLRAKSTHAKTDAEGRFRIEGLSAGETSLEVVAGQDLPVWLASREGLEVTTGSTIKDLRLEARPGGVLDLRVVNAATNEPVTDPGMVSVCLADDRRVSGMAGLSGGHARFGLAPGDYVLGEMQVFGYESRPSASDRWSVEAGSVREAELRLQPLPPSGGVVLDPSGQPVAGALVRIMPLGQGAREVVTGNDGRFGLAAADHGMYFLFLAAQHPVADLCAFEAVDPQLHHFELRLAPPVPIRGMVVDASGAAVDGALVVAHVFAPHLGRLAVMESTRSGADGRFELSAARTRLNLDIVATAPGRGTSKAEVREESLATGTVEPLKLTLKLAN